MLPNEDIAAAARQHRHKGYCSRACQNKANYERHTEAYRQQRVENYRKQKAQAASSCSNSCQTRERSATKPCGWKA